MKRHAIFLATGIALAAFATSAVAQTDTLYVTDGDSARLAIVQGGNLLATRTTFIRGYPIVVRSTIWIGDYNGAQANAHEFDLNGFPTSNSVPYSHRFAVDAGTDGVHNFELANAFSGNATVVMSDADFQNPVNLFNVPGQDLVGITYDLVSGSLWISDRNNIYNYSTSGTLLSQFAHTSGRGSLAWEPSTDTLWYVRNGSNTIDQYSKTGTFLQSVTVNGLISNNWGSEFAIPAPAAIALLGVAGLVTRRRRRWG